MSDYTTYDDDDQYDEEVVEEEVRRLTRPNRAARRAVVKDTPSALRREAEGVEYLGVEFRGQQYWMPADQLDWSAETILAFEDAKAMSALRGLLVHPDENGNGTDRKSVV